MEDKPKIEIVDMIDHRNAYGTQHMLVLNRYPQCLFERHGSLLIGNDDCIFRFFKYEGVGVHDPSHWKAFGGDEFDIPMADGSIERANGQWWDFIGKDYADLTYSYGMNTIEELHVCPVFMGGLHIDRKIVDEWREHNEPSNNYHKYDKRNKEFGQHRIVSQWDLQDAKVS